MVISRCAWTIYNFRRNLIADLRSRNYSVQLCGAGRDRFEASLRADGFDFQHIPVSLRAVDPAMDLWLFLRLLGLFIKTRPTIVHSFTVKPAVYATLAARLAAVPVRIVTITGLGYAFSSKRRRLRKLVEVFYRRALACADLVFFQNADDRRLFLDQGIVSESKARLVPGSGVCLNHFSTAALPCANGGVPQFIMISRLLKDKGVLEYIRAARYAKSRVLGATFRLVGALDSRNPSGFSAAEFATLNNDGAVDWVGELTDVRPLIAEADVVVLPSYREGTPRSLLEGAAMGRALVTTDTVGCRDVVEEGVTGFRVPMGDENALADAFIRLLNNPNQIQIMGRAARKMVEERFDERLVIRATVAAYEEVLREKQIDNTG